MLSGDGVGGPWDGEGGRVTGVCQVQGGGRVSNTPGRETQGQGWGPAGAASHPVSRPAVCLLCHGLTPPPLAGALASALCEGTPWQGFERGSKQGFSGRICRKRHGLLWATEKHVSLLLGVSVLRDSTSVGGDCGCPGLRCSVDQTPRREPRRGSGHVMTEGPCTGQRDPCPLAWEGSRHP